MKKPSLGVKNYAGRNYLNSGRKIVRRVLFFYDLGGAGTNRFVCFPRSGFQCIILLLLFPTSKMANLMKALVLYGPGDLRLESIAKPDAEPGSIVIRVIAAPLWDYAVCSANDLQKFSYN